MKSSKSASGEKPKKKPKTSKESSKRSTSNASPGASKAGVSSGVVSGSSTPTGIGLSSTTKPAPSGYLVSCDIPMKQFILKLNDEKTSEKKFILEDIDDTHLLIEGKAREEIRRAVEEWMDENIWSSAERVGENLGLD
jgi:hypothetical protein